MPFRSLLAPILLVPAFFVLALAVNAWTDPTQAPPNANTSAPLNTTSAAQTKAGDLVIASTGYLQFAKSFAGAPTATDCDNDAERGRLAIDTTNFRLYVCMGAARAWDYVALTN